MFERKPVRFVIFIISVYLIFSLVRSIISVLQKESIVVDEERKLVETREEHAMFTRKLESLKSPTFVEEQARNVLGLGKSGDYIAILPPVTVVPSPTPTPMLDPWEQWLRLFTGGKGR